MQQLPDAGQTAKLPGCCDCKAPGVSEAKRLDGFDMSPVGSISSVLMSHPE